MDQHLEDLGPLPALKRPYRPFQDPPMTRHCGQNIRFHHFAETVRDRYVPPRVRTQRSVCMNVPLGAEH